MGFSRKQKQILTFPTTKYTSLICDGAVRSGKTSVMAVSFILWIMHDFNQRNFAICGKSVQSAVRNVIRPLMSVMYFRQNGFDINYSASNHLLTVTRGNRVNYIYVFGGKDESSYQLIQGITLAGVFLDEVALMPRSFVEQAMARCSVDGSRYWFNCNPENPQHWFYQEWILKAKEKNALHIHFLMSDNPSLSQEILDRYEKQYTGVFYDRYIRGEWVLAEGRVYQFDENEYTTNDIPSKGKYYISIDYGTLNPFSAGLWCLSEGTAIRIKEYYYSGRTRGNMKTDEEYYIDLEKLAGDLPIEYVIVDPSAASFIATIRRHNKFSVRKAKNDVLDGIRLTSTLLKAGRILIHKSCADSIREFGLYCWDDKTEEDKPIKENDHAMDDIRYFVNTVLKRELRNIPELQGCFMDEET